MLDNWQEYVKSYYKDGLSLDEFNYKHHWITVAEADTLRVVQYDTLPSELKDASALDMFLRYHRTCFMYPLYLLDVHIGYGLRHIVSKAFHIILFYNSGSYYTSMRMVQNIDKFRYSFPIILVEGVADAMAVSHFYPWVIALMTNTITTLLLTTLPFITSKCYLMLDNDDSGNRGERLAKYKLKDTLLDVIEYPSRYKDPAEYYTEDYNGMRLLFSTLFGGSMFDGQAQTTAI